METFEAERLRDENGAKILPRDNIAAEQKLRKLTTV